jgi:N-acetylglucosaminyldiphosphoundecaprenol N-acetyl-beta-D-mannosaminyltransferase
VSLPDRVGVEESTRVGPAFAEHLGDLHWSAPCARCSRERELVEVNTVEFDVLTEESFAAAVVQFLECSRSHVVHFLAAHPTVVARRLETYRNLLNSGDLVVSDGTPIALMIRAKGHRAQRVTATDGFLRVCADGISREMRHYFLGGASETVATAFRDRLCRLFPKIIIAGFEVPPFRAYTNEELASLAAQIRASGADVVWVGVGAPKQDLLAHRLRVLEAAPAIVCIGAVFDFVAGTKPRAPSFIRAVGLEWFFRLVLEPRRLWRRYLVGNTRFVAGVLSDEGRRLLRSRVHQ